jgi:antitoxin ParD1/3/4
MTTLNISLPPALESFVDEQAAQQGFADSAEFVRELIRREQGRADLRHLLLEGAASPLNTPADAAYFSTLRARALLGPAPSNE